MLSEDPTTVNWDTWIPKERAVLCFIVRNGQVLLIRKKRGLGAGKINGPGGRLEPGELPLAAAIRETEEEVGLTPLRLREAGELSFVFADGYSLFGTVFTAGDCIGEAVETDEADPFWCAVDRIPYEEMWADDRLWLPHVLAGRYIRGRFLFDGDRMLTHHVETGKP